VAETADPAERAREICLRLLAVRPRTRTELATALRQRGIADEVAAEVLARYADVGIIDDRAFARAWVSSRHHGRGLARRALATELRHKGVDSETVGLALDELDAETEAATARALVDRKLRTEPGIAGRTPAERRGPTEALVRRLVGMLARKGYPPGLAVRVVRDALAAWSDPRRLAEGASASDAALETAGADIDIDLLVEALGSEASATDADASGARD
jgi:regulatory protein